MNRYSKSHIEQLALTHPMICAHLNAQRTNPGIGWQDMLHSLVVVLAEENAALRALLKEKENARV